MTMASFNCNSTAHEWIYAYYTLLSGPFFEELKVLHMLLFPIYLHNIFWGSLGQGDHMC